MMPAHMVGRSIVMSASLVDRIGGTRHRSAVEAHNPLADLALFVGRLVADIWSLRHQLQHVVDASTKDEKIDNDEDQQRRPYLLRRQRRDGICGAQHAVDDPGLASYFRGDPARE